ncbi:MAG: type II toxin-antitoxin system VapC family toxin [Chloroflexi bacterium]|nr:type II toxin-antitoxin system VapC family toxin [Chloroflexota bacterium]
MKYMLDTNICIYLIRHKPPTVRAHFEMHAVGEIGVSSLTVAELMYGVEKSQRPAQNRETLLQFLLPLVIVSFDHQAAVAYGRIRAVLEKAGTPIGALDMLIAAHALSLDVTLVSNNTREFTRVPGLRLTNWAKDKNKDE